MITEMVIIRSSLDISCPDLMCRKTGTFPKWVFGFDESRTDAKRGQLESAGIRQGSVKHRCQAVRQRELVRKGRFITFYSYVLSLEYAQALSSSICSDCNQQQHARDLLEHAH